MGFISQIFSYPLKFFYSFSNNYGIAIILFAVLVKLILLPFQMKSKKSTMKTSHLTPRMKELEKRYANDKNKYQEEVMKLYKDAGANPMSGCLWSLIPFPILIALYSIIRQPLYYMMNMSAEAVTKVQEVLTSLGFSDAIAAFKAGSEQIGLADLIYKNQTVPEVIAAVGDAPFMGIDYSFLGMNLGDTPQWNLLWTETFSDPAVWLPALGLFLIPIISGLFAFLQMKVSMKTNPAPEPSGGAGGTMNMMMYMMPLLSVYIGFIMPAALGLYWAIQGVLSIVQDYFMNTYYTKKLEAENADMLAEYNRKQELIEAKRAETEKLKAEGKTKQNPATSKDRKKALEQIKADSRRAEKNEQERLAKGDELPPSQVGTRTFARGRAYDPGRFADQQSEAENAASDEELLEIEESLVEALEPETETAQDEE
ncbi:membrane protein insertase YidC [Clostridiaceae bacterium OttesenSCG-928-D20]|nr:membrane protein insertase YidC [Clostridiaceae bacterium OttesenSCG-928-D20]